MTSSDFTVDLGADTNKPLYLLPLTIIATTYGFVSILLMAFLLIYFGVSKNFSMTIYRVVQVDILINILCWLITLPTFRLEVHPFFIPFLQNFEIYPGFLTFLKKTNFWFLHAQTYSAGGMILSRLLIIVQYGHYKTVPLNRIGFYAAVILVFSFVATFCSSPGTSYEILVENGTLYRTCHTDVLLSLLVRSSMFSIGYFSTLFLLSFVASWIMKKELKKLNLIMSKQAMQGATKLLKISLTYCGVYLGILGWTLFTFFNSKYHLLDISVDLSSVLLGFSSDLMTLSMPYIIFHRDRKVKEDVLPLLTFGLWKPTTTPSVQDTIPS